MEKQEYRAKTEQMLQYMSQKAYQQAADIADEIEWRRVKNVSMLCAVSEIYEYNGEYDKSREILFLAYERSPESRKIIYRLGILALKLNEIQEAEDCLEEFVKIAPSDSNQYVLKYKILKSKGGSLNEQIAALKVFKQKEYIEKWAYELAVVYQKAGMIEECIAECDDMILWFSEGRYVQKALELKKQYRPLTPLQREKYDLALQSSRKMIDLPKREAEVLRGVTEKAEILKRELFGKTEHRKAEHKKEESVKEESVKEEPIKEEPIKEEPIKEGPVQEELVQEELVQEEPVQEDLVQVEAEQAEFATKKPVKIAAVKVQEEVKQQIPALSIEEMLQKWEERQKENAQLIQEEYKKAAQDKAERESQNSAEKEEKDNLLPDDVRKLMEELETEAAVFESQKVKQEAAADIVKKPTFGAMIGAVLEPVMEAVRNSSDKNVEEEFEAWLSGDEETEAAENAQDSSVVGNRETAVVTKAEVQKTSEEPVVEIEPVSDEELQKVVSHGFETSVIQAEQEVFLVEEEPGIKMGDTQSMAAAARALKNQAAVEEGAAGSMKTESAAVREEVFIVQNEAESTEKSAAENTGSQTRVRPQNPYDTGFIVQGRYDLDAQSHVGLKAGLTEEQKKLFSYFVPVHGMSEQLVEVLQNDKKCRDRYGTSRIGNILIIGRKGSGKTVLAVDVVKAIQKARKLKQGKVGIVTADSLNKKDVVDIFTKLYGGAIIIEKASHLSRRSIEDMCDVMEGQTEELLVVLEDERQPLERMLEQYPQFKKKFTSKLELPVFINDELVTFGQTYAKENGYKIDEMGILALYSRIDMLQRDEYIVTVSDVKEIIDEAIDNSQRANFKKVMKKLFGKNKDEAARIILKEEDFK